jgi:uncharacterized membrane protein
MPSLVSERIQVHARGNPKQLAGTLLIGPPLGWLMMPAATSLAKTKRSVEPSTSPLSLKPEESRHKIKGIIMCGPPTPFGSSPSAVKAAFVSTSLSAYFN